jgi:hypothetical protein
MFAIARNGFLVYLLACAPSCASSSPPPRRTATAPAARPLVGAIRWDAWFGDDTTSTVGREVEQSLAPPEWHGRLPFFAAEVSPTQVQVRSNRQSVMDAEIRYAHDAGIDYWAFVMYAPQLPMTTGGIDLYLSSAAKRDVHFCMIAEHLDNATIARLIAYFKDASYQRVLGTRPLVYLLGPQRRDDPAWPDARASIAELRQRAAAAGVDAPYLVHLWGWDGGKALVAELDLDAESAYSLQFDDRAAPYATLAAKTEAKWDEWRDSGLKVVPLVTAGWDRRPRVACRGSPRRRAGTSVYSTMPPPRRPSWHGCCGTRWPGARATAPPPSPTPY